MINFLTDIRTKDPLILSEITVYHPFSEINFAEVEKLEKQDNVCCVVSLSPESFWVVRIIRFADVIDKHIFIEKNSTIFFKN